jgi:helix-turn-helix protein
MIFTNIQINFKADVPKTIIKGKVKVQIEIDDKPNLLNPLNTKRIKITCFDFELEDKFKMYANRNPIILKTWS